MSLWYEFDPDRNKSDIIAEINADLEKLKIWGDDNNTTFEKSKMEMVLVSLKRSPFDVTGIQFDNYHIPCKPHIKLVGYTIDSKLRWRPMLDRIAKKAKSRVGALRRVQRFLDQDNMKTMYTAFIRSIMKFGSVAWMGAAPTHLVKLDRVQDTMQRIGGFKVETLQSRREAAAVAFGLKLLSGSCKGVLNKHIPELCDPSSCPERFSRHALEGIQIEPVVKSNSLNVFERGFHGSLPHI